MAMESGAELPEVQVQMVRAAYQLMSERGVARVSLEEVAAASGVSKGLVLYYFKTRENLILRMMEWVLGQVASRIRAAVAKAPTPRDKVRAMVDVIFAGSRTNRRFYLTYLELVQHAARFERFGRLSAAFREQENGLYEEVVRSGVEAGAFQAADVAATATVLRAILEGLFVQWLQEPDPEASHPAYKRLCEAALLHYLGAA
jgi:TetR/AcrR family transcriptional regulator, fatty acid metabolism regulator protein